MMLLAAGVTSSAWSMGLLAWLPSVVIGVVVVVDVSGVLMPVSVGDGNDIGFGVGVVVGMVVDVGVLGAGTGGHGCPSVTRKSATWMLCGLWPFSHACVAISISTNGFVSLPVAWHIVTFSPAWATPVPRASSTARTMTYFMLVPLSLARPISASGT